ncbi:MAG: hypothetical protein MNPFHGCM_02516 [Gemmatimonadaceae bacterium]|nr:hypothetical protein [Gemmatimonadaceae bacterium]
MNIQPGIARLCFFDFHFAPAPLRAPRLFQPAVTFLGTPADYDGRHSRTWQVDTSRFRLRPLRAAFQHSHFWKALSALCDREGSNELNPRYHIPVEARLRDTVAFALLPSPFDRVKVRTWLLIWPYGWSTRLELTLPGPAGLSALVDASRMLHDDPVFDVQSESGAAILTSVLMTDVLRKVTAWIQADLFTGMVPDKRPVSRKCVMSLSRFANQTEPFTYNPDVHPELPGLPTADRARLHGVLLGRTVPNREVLQRETEGRFLLTPLRATGFALTDFGRGSLLVLQDAAPRVGTDTTAVRCLWRNTAAMLTTMDALLSVDRDARATPPDWLNTSADWAVRILGHLPTYYDNLICHRVLETHSATRAR